jgi:chromosome segregation ATPase
MIMLLSIAGVSLVAGQALADAANLQSALQHLQAARNDLEGGGKKNDDARAALAHVEQAIDGVRRGIDQEKKKEAKAAKEAANKQEKAAKQEQNSLDKAAKQGEKAQEKAAEQAKKAQKKAGQPDQAAPAQ